MPERESAALGALLRRWRERALLTQEQLAELTGLGVRTIRRMESGAAQRARMGSIRLLAPALGLSEEELAQLTSAALGQVAAAAVHVPRQLPAGVAGFTGRVQELRELDRVLADGQEDEVVIAAITGSAGVGKTALAVHWAHRSAGRFPDGQLYLNLRGFDPSGKPATLATVARSLLDALTVPLPQLPADMEAQLALYRSLLAGRRILVVLDNARDADQVRPLLPGAPGCAVVITSRDRLTSIVATEGAHVVPVDLLSIVESRELLRRRLGNRVSAEPEAVDAIIRSCERLPLALAVVAARAVTVPSLALTSIATEMRETAGRLSTLGTGDAQTDVRTVFSWSYERLGAGAASMFRMLGWHPGPEIDVFAAASLAAISEPQARALLAEVAQSNLINPAGPDRYTVHDLLRLYAGELAQQAEQDRHSCVRRLMDHYVHTAVAADRLLYPVRDPEPAGECAEGVLIRRLSSHDEAMEWFEAEADTLLSMVDLAQSAGLPREGWQLAWAMASFLERCGRLHHWAGTQLAALDGAERLGDWHLQAVAARNIGRAYTMLDQLRLARRYLQRARVLARRAGDVVQQAHAHVNLAQAADSATGYHLAMAHFMWALELYRAAGHRMGIANALNAAGWLSALNRHYDLALDYCQQALALHDALGNRSGQAPTLDSIGYALHHLGRYQEAQTYLSRALEVARQLGNRYTEAVVLEHLGDNHFATGDRTGARKIWGLASEILTDIGSPEAQRLRAEGLQRDLLLLDGLAVEAEADGLTRTPKF